MQIISVLGQKGGSGKTTLALALAVRAVKAGRNVAVLDLDTQGSARKWAKRRATETPAVARRDPYELQETVEALREGGADLVIVDTPGKIEAAATAAAKVADLVLIPVRPTALDLDALDGLNDLLRVAGDPLAYVVLNAVPPQGRAYESARAIVEQKYSLKVCPIFWTQRAIFAAAMIDGKTAGEHEPKGKASEEIEKLYSLVVSISQNLNMKGKGDGKAGLSKTA
jgi:chromosome partitioning protein